MLENGAHSFILAISIAPLQVLYYSEFINYLRNLVITYALSIFSYWSE